MKLDQSIINYSFLTLAAGGTVTVEFEFTVYYIKFI